MERNRMSEGIEHTGIIKKLSGEKIIVGIINESACASCHAKGACTAADMKDKDIEIEHFTGDFRLGQQVRVIGKTSQGFKALFYGYVLPFLLLMATLIISLQITQNEGLSGLFALGILVPYYFVLYLFRNKLKRSFEFEIKPLQ
ncbi:SoxR reducing system RseC family protein [Gaoshiqia sediminis]|uniref:SoxR reducing system RseC family protein n=1 Tax=Gaoshiqia sediminis TaxID=2986998 RepID=A0AA41Y724_9BACT|nr:SoxR reducing system RseC family protein [Gaoshiqia sediminis]MCW0482098.1 SoxR reducing system RseC family protein [Gaoshiqia sediminis]